MESIKRLISLVLVVVMLFSFVPATAMDVIAADASHSVDAATATNRTNTLIKNLVGKYFTTTQSTCGNSKCDKCKNSNVIGTTWLKNTMGLVPDSASLLPEHYYSSSGIVTSTAWSCAGFANYCLWYIYAKNPSDNIRRVNIYSGAYNKSNMDNSGVRTGDVIRVADRHSFIYISHDSSGVTVLDSNWDSATPNLVKKHVISWSWRSGSTMAITRGKNWTGQHTHSYTGQRVYEKAHPHKISQRCVDYATCGGFKWTGEEAATYGDKAYEGAHPHRYYRRCTISGCDYYYYTGDNASVKTCSSCWNGTFNVSESSVNVKVNESKTINISLNGCFPDGATVYADYDKNIISVTRNGKEFTFKGLKKGTCNYVIYVCSDTSKKTVICTKTIPVTVTEHVHSYTITGYEAVHPHRIYKQCSCGATQLTGEEAATYGDKAYEGAHPHRYYRRCTISGCDYYYYTGDNASVKTCSSCWNGTFNVSESSVNIKVNESKTINISLNGYFPDGATVYAEYDKSLISVTSSGQNYTFKGLKNGSCNYVITVYSDSSKNKVICSETIPITVTKPESVLESITIKSLPYETTYYIGAEMLKTLGLALNANYSDGSSQTIISGYTTSGFDTSGAGTKTITVSYGGKTTAFKVTVKSPSVTLALESKTLNAGDTYTLSATSDPQDVTLMWSSYDADIASVSNGKVTAKSEGEVIIKVKFSYNGIVYSDTCTVKVTAAGCKHKYTTVYDAVDSTCTTQGHKSYTVCDDCKAVISGSNEPLPLVDHIPGEYIVTREPTYNVVGIETCFCTGCGKQLDRRQIPVLEYVNKFTDVKPSHWFWESVNYVARKGFMSGMSETKFSPNTELTREQFIQILFAMEGKDKSDYTGATGFVDVAEGKWYSPAIKWAKQEGVSDGIGHGKFGLGANVTREQMAKFMMSFAVYKEYNTDARGDISVYKDANKIASWAKEPMQWCVGVGIYESTSNTEKKLEPRLSVKRSVAATVIMRFVKATSK